MANETETSWSPQDYLNLATNLNIGSGIASGVTNLASGIANAINSTHAQRQAGRQATRLKNEQTQYLDDYLNALDENDNEYLNALNSTDWDSLYDLSNYGYDTTGDKYDADKYMDKETNFIIQNAVGDANGKSALGGMGHSSGALNSAVNTAVAKSNELRESARSDALKQKQSDLDTANTLSKNAVSAKNSYIDALKSVMDRNDANDYAEMSGKSQISTNYRNMQANA